MLSIDSHCHPQFPQYDSDREEVIKHSLKQGVGMICVGTDLEMSKKAIGLAEKYEGIWASVGIHPNDISEQFSVSSFELLVNYPKVIAIGEVGLDYYRTTEPEKQKLQKDIFRQFLQLAQKVKKPVIVHSRQAFEDTYKILFEFPGISGVIHSFTYSFEQAQKFFDLGFYIGLNGIITFTDQYNDTVKNAPLDKILLETDAPFLAPVPHRGKKNEPAYVKFVAEQIAKVCGIPVEEINKVTTENAKKLFRIQPK